MSTTKSTGFCFCDNPHEESEMTCSQERVKRYDAGGCVYREEANFYIGISTSSTGKVVPRKSDRSARITPPHPGPEVSHKYTNQIIAAQLSQRSRAGGRRRCGRGRRGGGPSCCCRRRRRSAGSARRCRPGARPWAWPPPVSASWRAMLLWAVPFSWSSAWAWLGELPLPAVSSAGSAPSRSRRSSCH